MIIACFPWVVENVLPDCASDSSVDPCPFFSIAHGALYKIRSKAPTLSGGCLTYGIKPLGSPNKSLRYLWSRSAHFSSSCIQSVGALFHLWVELLGRTKSKRIRLVSQIISWGLSWESAYTADKPTNNLNVCVSQQRLFQNWLLRTI